MVKMKGEHEKTKTLQPKQAIKSVKNDKNNDDDDDDDDDDIENFIDLQDDKEINKPTPIGDNNKS